MLRLSEFDEDGRLPCLRIDHKKKQASLIDPRSLGVSPRLGKEAKLYPFDAMFDANSTKVLTSYFSSTSGSNLVLEIVRCRSCSSLPFFVINAQPPLTILL